MDERVLEYHSVLWKVLAFRDVPKEGFLGSQHLNGARRQSGQPF
jgi:hypothetical protein